MLAEISINLFTKHSDSQPQLKNLESTINKIPYLYTIMNLKICTQNPCVNTEKYDSIQISVKVNVQQAKQMRFLPCLDLKFQWSFLFTQKLQCGPQCKLLQGKCVSGGGGGTHSKLCCDQHEKLLNQFLCAWCWPTTRCVEHNVPLLARVCPFDHSHCINLWTMTPTVYQEVDLRLWLGEEWLFAFLQPDTEDLRICESGGCWRKHQALRGLKKISKSL